MYIWRKRNFSVDQSFSLLEGRQQMEALKHVDGSENGSHSEGSLRHGHVQRSLSFQQTPGEGSGEIMHWREDRSIRIAYNVCGTAALIHTSFLHQTR